MQEDSHLEHGSREKHEEKKRRKREEENHRDPHVHIKKESSRWSDNEQPVNDREEKKVHHHDRASHRKRDERGSHGRGEERTDHHHREQRDRHQPHPREWKEQQHERSQNDRRRQNNRRENNTGERSDGSFGKVKEEKDDKKPIDKEKPNFELSGKLTEDANLFHGVVVQYSEPPEARKSKRHWRLYTFKGDDTLPTLHIHRQSAYLLGRDRRVADIPIDHPSCSKQHAALQYRLVNYRRPDGKQGRRVRLYVIDLNSANGTYINNQRIEGQKYVELLEKDVVKFGFSTREYVLLHDKTDTSELHDDEVDDDDEGAE